MAFGYCQHILTIFHVKVVIGYCGCSVLFCSLAVLDPRVCHTMDVLSPFISILCHSD